jgi:hypothetical protein
MVGNTFLEGESILSAKEFSVRKNNVLSELPRKVDEEFKQRGLIGYLPKEDIGTQAEECYFGDIVRTRSLHGAYKNLSVVEVVMFPREGFGKSWGNFVLRPKDSVRVYGGIDIESGIGSYFSSFTQDMINEKGFDYWRRIVPRGVDMLDPEDVKDYSKQGLYAMASVNVESSKDFMGDVARKVVDITDFQRKIIKTREVASGFITKEQRENRDLAMEVYRNIFEGGLK